MDDQKKKLMDEFLNSPFQLDVDTRKGIKLLLMPDGEFLYPTFQQGAPGLLDYYDATEKLKEGKDINYKDFSVLSNYIARREAGISGKISEFTVKGMSPSEYVKLVRTLRELSVKYNVERAIVIEKQNELDNHLKLVSDAGEDN